MQNHDQRPSHLPASQDVAGGTPYSLVFALCQDCLASVQITREEIADADIRNGDGNHLCPLCAGDLCDCPACAAEAEKLYADGGRPGCFQTVRDGYACGRPKQWRYCQHCGANAATWSDEA